MGGQRFREGGRGPKDEWAGWGRGGYIFFVFSRSVILIDGRTTRFFFKF